MPEPWETPLHEYAKLPEATSVPRGTILAMHPDAITARSPYAANRDYARSNGDGAIDPPHRRVCRAGGPDPGRPGVTPPAAPRQHTRSCNRCLGKELRAMLKGAKLYVPSNKYGMAAALLNWREECKNNGRHASPNPGTSWRFAEPSNSGSPVPAQILADYPELAEENNPMPLFDGKHEAVVRGTEAPPRFDR